MAVAVNIMSSGLPHLLPKLSFSISYNLRCNRRFSVLVTEEDTSWNTIYLQITSGTPCFVIFLSISPKVARAFLVMKKISFFALIASVLLISFTNNLLGNNGK